jgi:hypothetical protein
MKRGGQIQGDLVFARDDAARTDGESDSGSPHFGGNT